MAGEVALSLNGEIRRAKLTLGALAELEAALGTDTLTALVERFESGRFSGRDLLALLVAGLRGGGWQGSAEDLVAVSLGHNGREGAAAGAAAAAELLARAFALPAEQ